MLELLTDMLYCFTYCCMPVMMTPSNFYIYCTHKFNCFLYVSDAKCDSKYSCSCQITQIFSWGDGNDIFHSHFRLVCLWSWSIRAISDYQNYSVLYYVPNHSFCTRQHICYSVHMLSPVRLSVCPSIRPTHVWISQKKVDVRIMQLSPPGSPMTLGSSW